MVLSRLVSRAAQAGRRPVNLARAGSLPVARIQRARAYATAAEEEDDKNLNGNYPEYPYVFNQKRDPYEKYDDQQLRRNFNDPLHEDDDLLNMWSPDVHDHVPTRTAALSILAFFALVGVSSVGLSRLAPEPPAGPRVYENGLFEDLGGSEAFSDIYSAGKDDGTYYPK